MDNGRPLDLQITIHFGGELEEPGMVRQSKVLLRTADASSWTHPNINLVKSFGLL